MANGGFGAFGQAAFFETSRDIRKQREEERATSVREGLAERQVTREEAAETRLGARFDVEQTAAGLSAARSSITAALTGLGTLEALRDIGSRARAGAASPDIDAQILQAQQAIESLMTRFPGAIEEAERNSIIQEARISTARQVAGTPGETRRLSTDPVTQRREIVDLATAETTPVGGQPVDQPAAAAPEAVAPQAVAPSLTDQRPPLTVERERILLDNISEGRRSLNILAGAAGDIVEGTGPGAQIAPAFDFLAGLFGGRAFEDTVDARERVRVLAQTLKTALVNNPRFPVAETELVARLLPDPDTFFTNPRAEAAKARDLTAFILTKTFDALAEQQGQSLVPPNHFQQPDAIIINPSTGELRFLNPFTNEYEGL